eukprot:7798931-Ditylum_brightwellii.AAC.1
MVEPPVSLFYSPSFLTTTTTTSGHIWVHHELLDALLGAQWLWRHGGDAINKMAKMATPFPPQDLPPSHKCKLQRLGVLYKYTTTALGSAIQTH